jgi:NADP-dependent 3-hydroxy acid dehydrogenase YdfG
MLNLSGRIVMVTGASSGFGEATALRYATLGAAIALVARTESKLLELASKLSGKAPQVLVLPTDLENSDQVAMAHAKTQREMGEIEILVNNAGMNVAARSVADTTLQDWDSIMAVNLRASFQLAKLVLPGMKRSGHGSIVNVASRAANNPSLLSGVAYSSSKIGMEAMNRILNEEGNPHGVRSILINPGVGATPLLDRRPAPPPAEARKRMLQAGDIADAIVFSTQLPYRVCIDQMNVYPTDPHVG